MYSLDIAFSQRMSAFALSAVMISAIAFGSGPASAKKPESTIGGPLLLRDFGSFFVNGEEKLTLYSGNAGPDLEPEPITVNQMYVQYMIPQQKPKMWPVIMMHGGTHSGKTYETTPDGREGWATYFVRHKMPAYVTDAPGRGKSGFDRSVINKARILDDTSILPGIGVSSNEDAWTTFRFGPELGVPFDDTQFPTEAADQYFAQLNPSAETTLEGGESVNTPDALVALLDKIGPAVVMVHSRSGPFGLEVALRRPDLVKAVIAVEPISCALSDEDVAAFVDIPYLVVFGDHLSGFFLSLFENQCQDTVDRINAAGGTALNLHLPAVGEIGNSHMVMLDRNNLNVADIIMDWMESNVPH